MTTFSTKNYNKKTPQIWGRVSTSLRYFLVGVIGTISATDIINPAHVKISVLVMSLLILALKSVDLGLGVSEENTTGTQK